MSNFVRKKITRCLIYDFRPREYELCVALNDIFVSSLKNCFAVVQDAWAVITRDSGVASWCSTFHLHFEMKRKCVPALFFSVYPLKQIIVSVTLCISGTNNDRREV
jgi:hypothetical protein